MFTRVKLLLKFLTLLAVLGIAVPATAQPQKGTFTTLQTTNTSASSLKVGCAIGSSSCTGGIISGPVDVVSITSAGFLQIANNVPASTTFRLYNNAGTLYWNGTALATGSTVSGTTGTIAKFTGSSAVGNSIMTEASTTVTVAGTLAATALTGSCSGCTAIPAANLSGTIASGVQDAITRLGTIASGVWNGTKVALAYGGTGADLSGTGGTSQFLRQASLGGAVTVVQPAISDLTDGGNIVVTTSTYSNPSWLTALDAAKITSGTLPLARLSGITTTQMASANISQFTNNSGYYNSASTAVTFGNNTSISTSAGFLVVTSPTSTYLRSTSGINIGDLGTAILSLQAGGGETDFGGVTIQNAGYPIMASTTAISISGSNQTIAPGTAGTVFVTPTAGTDTIANISGGIEGRRLNICVVTTQLASFNAGGNIAAGTSAYGPGTCATAVYHSSFWYLMH